MRLIEIFAATLLLAVLALAGCAVNPVTGKRELALMQVSDTEEIDIGKKAFGPALQQMGGEYNDPQLAAYVNNVGQRLARLSARSNLPYEFKVVNDSSPNAFALPGGSIAISRGLLVNLENEAQLASVLGHEVGHVDARHSVQGMQRGTLLNVGLSVLSGVTGGTGYSAVAQQAGQLAASLLDNSYSREQERESDRLGIDYMVRAGYNPIGAVQLQEFFYRKIEGGAEPMWLSGLFRTHPFSKERLEANEAYIRSHHGQALNNPNSMLLPEPLMAATARLRQTQAAYDLYDQARQMEGQGNLSQAVATYLQAAAAAPDEALILTGLGMAYLKAEDEGSARRHLERAVQLDGNYYMSRMGLGYVYLQQKQDKQAVEELEASMKLLPSLQGGFLLAEGYEKTGQKQKAAQLYQDVAKADPQGKLGRAAAAKAKALGGI